MSDSRQNPTDRTDSRQSIAAAARRAAPRERIDCGGARDQAEPAARVTRYEGGDARRGYLTITGSYADQVQAI